MLLMPSLQSEVVTIFFHTNAIICSWIQKNKTATASLLLRAYEHYPLDNLILHNLIPFNITLIKKYIHAFLQKYNLENAFIVFCLDAATIEEYIIMPTSTPHRHDFAIAQTPHLYCEYRHFYSNHDGQHVFYVYTLPRSLILQYQLLAIALQCNVITITTKTAAHYEAYKYLFGTAFRKSQLAMDMIRSHNNIENIISVDALRRMIVINNTIDVKNEKSFIAAACGLFCSERIFS